MTSTERTCKRSNAVRRIAAGLLVITGFAVAAASPALADRKRHHGNHGDKHHQRHYENEGRYYYYDEPQVIYVEPRPVYVRPQRVYVQPAPVYYEPAPVIYQRPSINVIFPIFD